MVDHALIALSPAVEGSPEHFQHERNKALLMCQYLKALGYNVRFLVPEGMSVPFSTDKCTRTDLLKNLSGIKEDADGDSNVIYYFSGSPREATRIPIFLRNMYRVLTGRIKNPYRERVIIRTFLRRISSRDGVRVNTHMICQALQKLISTRSSVFIDIRRVMGLLGNISREKITKISDWNFIVEAYDPRNIARRAHIHLPNDEMVRLLDIKEDAEPVGFNIGPRHLAQICDAMIGMGETFHLDVTALMRYLREMGIYIMLEERSAYLPLSRNLTLNGLVFMTEIDDLLCNTTSHSMIVLGSGRRSGIFSEYLRSDDRIAIASMGPDRASSIDYFNFGNGLVRASYTNLRKYTKGKNIDPLKAISLEMIRMAKNDATRGQNPMAFFNYDYLQTRDLLPYFPPQPQNTTRLNTYDPRIGAFLIRYIPKLPPITGNGSIPAGGSGSSVVSSSVSVPIGGPTSSVLPGGGG